jgi:protein-S-isoprenylcysteine O-methyltransferase Ste14
MKMPSPLRNLLLLALAIVFSAALMFAFVELPLLLDSALADKVEFPGLDHGRDAISAYKADVYISALNLRWIGYGCLGLVLVFIIIGFITKRSGWGLAGAFALFLPVFGQFAMSMFFLAGLGMLRVGWMPFWDISWNVLDMGDVIYIPFWILMWVFRQFNYWAQPELAWFFMGLGAFLFTWGVLVWMQARFSKKAVATSWIYRISRHPQYLGWIIWSYGLVIYSPLVNQMKKSWGMASSLPFLLMTMIIIGMCLMEEIRMREKYGEAFEKYRNCLLYTSPSPRDRQKSRMPSSA